jgi:hypothetical protein
MKNQHCFGTFFAFSRRRLIALFSSIPAADLLSSGGLDAEMQPAAAMGILDGVADYRR